MAKLTPEERAKYLKDWVSPVRATKPMVDSGIFSEPDPADVLRHEFARAYASMCLIQDKQAEGATFEEALESLPAHSLKCYLRNIKGKMDAICEPHEVDIVEWLEDSVEPDPDMPDVNTLAAFAKAFLSEEKWEEIKSVRLIPLTAPPIAVDASNCRCRIDQLNSALEQGNVDLAIKHAIEIGYLYCKTEVRSAEPNAALGKKMSLAQRSGGKATSKATAQEKDLIITARNTLAKERDWPTAKAAEMIAAQLRTGRFPGIDRVIDYSDKYVANLRAQR